VSWLLAGLYGLVPIIADIRGFLARYNWIGDLLLLIATPVENLVNANFFPLPQVCTPSVTHCKVGVTWCGF
jgi:hypothetical protein